LLRWFDFVQHTQHVMQQQGNPAVNNALRAMSGGVLTDVDKMLLQSTSQTCDQANSEPDM
jgi:hypothetical protein